MIDYLKGKKTYFLAVLGILTVGAWKVGAMDAEMASQILTALGFGGMITLRAGIAKVVVAGLLVLTLAGCATAPAVADPTAPPSPVATDPTPLQALADALDKLANNPLIVAANKDAADTLAWVNGPNGPTDPMLKSRATQCPDMVQKATGNLQASIAKLKEQIAGLETQIAGSANPGPELILFFTKLRYGPAGTPGADLKSMIASAQHDIFERVTAVADSCRGIFPAKQAKELMDAAVKVGGVAVTGGAAAPIVGMLP
jgi:hypothetical protein